ncbi:MAG: DUF4418 family protein [Treponema sp.]|nr:DUF4418 family protein [Treponema sp.]
MKIKIIFGAVIIAVGLLLAVGPQTIFTACKGRLNDVREAGFKELLSIVEQEGIENVTQTVKEKGITGLQKEKGITIILREIPMRCHWGARIEMGIGAMIALLGLAIIIFGSAKTALGLTISAGFSGIISLLIPTNILIGVCGAASMHCRTHFAPAVTSLSILLIIVCALYVFILAKAKKD